MRKDDPTVRYFKAVDEETNKMIAFTKWHIYDTTEAAGASSRPLNFRARRNKDACMAFLVAL